MLRHLQFIQIAETVGFESLDEAFKKVNVCIGRPVFVKTSLSFVQGSWKLNRTPLLVIPTFPIWWNVKSTTTYQRQNHSQGKILFLTEYFSNLFFLEFTANKKPFQKVSEIIIGKSVLWKILLIMISCDQTSLLHRLCKCLKNTVKAKSFQRHWNSSRGKSAIWKNLLRSFYN